MRCFFITEWSPSLWADQGFHPPHSLSELLRWKGNDPVPRLKRTCPSCPCRLAVTQDPACVCLLIINQIPDSAPPNKDLVLQHVSHKVTEAERYADDSMPNTITWLRHWQATSRKHSALNSNTFVFVRESESTAFQCIAFSHVTNSITNTSSVFTAPHQRFLSFGSTLCVL